MPAAGDTQSGTPVPLVGATMLDEVKLLRKYLLCELPSCQYYDGSQWNDISEADQAAGTASKAIYATLVESGDDAPSGTVGTLPTNYTISVDKSATAGLARVWLTVVNSTFEQVSGGYDVYIHTKTSGGAYAGVVKLAGVQFLYVQKLSAVLTSALPGSNYVSGNRVVIKSTGAAEDGTELAITATAGVVDPSDSNATHPLYFDVSASETPLFLMKVTGGTGSYPSFAVLEADDATNNDRIKMGKLSGAVSPKTGSSGYTCILGGILDEADATYFAGSKVQITYADTSITTTYTVDSGSAYNPATGDITFTGSPTLGTVTGTNATYKFVDQFRITDTNTTISTVKANISGKIYVYDSAARVLGDSSTSDGIQLVYSMGTAPSKAGSFSTSNANFTKTTLSSTEHYYETSQIATGGGSDTLTGQYLFQINLALGSFYSGFQSDAFDGSATVFTPSFTSSHEGSSYNPLTTDFTAVQSVVNATGTNKYTLQNKYPAFKSSTTEQKFADPQATLNKRPMFLTQIVVKYGKAGLAQLKKTFTYVSADTLTIGLYRNFVINTAPTCQVAVNSQTASGAVTYIGDPTILNVAYSGELAASNQSKLYVTAKDVWYGLGDGTMTATLNDNSITLYEEEAPGTAGAAMVKNGNSTNATKTYKAQVASSALNVTGSTGDSGGTENTSNELKFTVLDDDTGIDYTTTKTNASIRGRPQPTDGSALAADFTAAPFVTAITDGDALLCLGASGSGSIINCGMTTKFYGNVTVSGGLATANGVTNNGATAQVINSSNKFLSFNTAILTAGSYSDGVQTLDMTTAITITDEYSRSADVPLTNDSMKIYMRRALSFLAGINNDNVIKIPLTAAQIAATTEQSIEVSTYTLSGGSSYGVLEPANSAITPTANVTTGASTFTADAVFVGISGVTMNGNLAVGNTTLKLNESLAVTAAQFMTGMVVTKSDGTVIGTVASTGVDETTKSKIVLEANTAVALTDDLALYKQVQKGDSLYKSANGTSSWTYFGTVRKYNTGTKLVTLAKNAIVAVDTDEFVGFTNMTGYRRNLASVTCTEDGDATNVTTSYTVSSAHNTEVVVTLHFDQKVQTNQLYTLTYAFGAVHDPELTNPSSVAKKLYFTSQANYVRFREVATGTNHTKSNVRTETSSAYYTGLKVSSLDTSGTNATFTLVANAGSTVHPDKNFYTGLVATFDTAADGDVLATVVSSGTGANSLITLANTSSLTGVDDDDAVSFATPDINRFALGPSSSSPLDTPIHSAYKTNAVTLTSTSPAVISTNATSAQLTTEGFAVGGKVYTIPLTGANRGDAVLVTGTIDSFGSGADDGKITMTGTVGTEIPNNTHLAYGTVTNPIVAQAYFGENIDNLGIFDGVPVAASPAVATNGVTDEGEAVISVGQDPTGSFSANDLLYKGTDNEGTVSDLLGIVLSTSASPNSITLTQGLEAELASNVSLYKGVMTSSGTGNDLSNNSGISIRASATGSVLAIVDDAGVPVGGTGITPSLEATSLRTWTSAATFVMSGTKLKVTAATSIFTAADAYVADVWERLLQLPNGHSIIIGDVTSTSIILSEDDYNGPVPPAGTVTIVRQYYLNLGITNSALHNSRTNQMHSEFTTEDLTFTQYTQLMTAVGGVMKQLETYGGTTNTTTMSISALTGSAALNLQYEGYEFAVSMHTDIHQVALLASANDVSDSSVKRLNANMASDYDEDISQTEAVDSKVSVWYQFDTRGAASAGHDAAITMSFTNATWKQRLNPTAGAWRKNATAGSTYPAVTHSTTITPVAGTAVGNLTINLGLSSAANKYVVFNSGTSNAKEDLNDFLKTDVKVYKEAALTTLIGVIASVTTNDFKVTFDDVIGGAVLVNGASVYTATSWAIQAPPHVLYDGVTGASTNESTPYNVFALCIEVISAEKQLADSANDTHLTITADGYVEVDAKMQFTIDGLVLSDTEHSPAAANGTFRLHSALIADTASYRAFLLNSLPNVNAKQYPVLNGGSGYAYGMQNNAANGNPGTITPQTTGSVIGTLQSLFTTVNNYYGANLGLSGAYTNALLAYVGNNGGSQPFVSDSVGGALPLSMAITTNQTVNSKYVAVLDNLGGGSSGLNYDPYTATNGTNDQILTNFGTGANDTAQLTNEISGDNYTITYTMTPETGTAVTGQQAIFALSFSEYVKLTATPFTAYTPLYASTAANYGLNGTDLTAQLHDGGVAWANENAVTVGGTGDLVKDILNLHVYMLTEDAAFNATTTPRVTASSNLLVTIGDGVAKDTATCSMSGKSNAPYDNSGGQSSTKMMRQVHTYFMPVVTKDPSNPLSGKVSHKVAGLYPGWLPASEMETGLIPSTIGAVYDDIKMKDITRVMGGVIDFYGTWTAVQTVGGLGFNGTHAYVAVSGDQATQVTANFAASISGVTSGFFTGKYPMVGNGNMSASELATFLQGNAEDVYTPFELRTRLGFRMPGAGNAGHATDYDMLMSVTDGGTALAGSGASMSGTGVITPYFVDGSGNEVAQAYIAAVSSVTQAAGTVKVPNDVNYTGMVLTVTNSSVAANKNKFMRTISNSVYDANYTTLTLLGGWETSGDADDGYYISNGDTCCITNPRAGYDVATDTYRINWKFNSNLADYVDGEALGVVIAIRVSDYANTNVTKTYSDVDFQGVSPSWTVNWSGTQRQWSGVNVPNAFTISTQWMSNKPIQKLVGNNSNVFEYLTDNKLVTFSTLPTENRVFASATYNASQSTGTKITAESSFPSSGSLVRVVSVYHSTESSTVSTLGESWGSTRNAISALEPTLALADSAFSRTAVGNNMLAALTLTIGGGGNYSSTPTVVVKEVIDGVETAVSIVTTVTMTGTAISAVTIANDDYGTYSGGAVVVTTTGGGQTTAATITGTVGTTGIQVVPTTDIKVTLYPKNSSSKLKDGLANGASAVTDANGSITEVGKSLSLDEFYMQIELNPDINNALQFQNKTAANVPRGTYAVLMRGSTDESFHFIRCATLNIGAVQAVPALTLNKSLSWADHAVLYPVTAGTGTPTVDPEFKKTGVNVAAGGAYNASGQKKIKTNAATDNKFIQGMTVYTQTDTTRTVSSVSSTTVVVASGTASFAAGDVLYFTASNVVGNNAADDYILAGTLSAVSTDGLTLTFGTAFPSAFVATKKIFRQVNQGVVDVPYSYTISLTHTNSGTNYSNGAPTCVFTGGGGSGAAATAVLGSGAAAHTVVSFTMTSQGTGYTSAPTFSLTGGSPGSQAAATLTFDGFVTLEGNLTAAIADGTQLGSGYNNTDGPFDVRLYAKFVHGGSGYTGHNSYAGTAALKQIGTAGLNKTWDEVKAYLATPLPMRRSAEKVYPTATSASSVGDHETLMQYAYSLRLSSAVTSLQGNLDAAQWTGLMTGSDYDDDDGYILSPLFTEHHETNFRGYLANATSSPPMGTLDSTSQGLLAFRPNWHATKFFATKLVADTDVNAAMGWGTTHNRSDMCGNDIEFS
jgi:hypothetical protein